MRASFRGLLYGPEAVDLVECHGTSTRQGDLEEVRALRAVYDSSKSTRLLHSSPKSDTPWALRALTASFAESWL